MLQVLTALQAACSGHMAAVQAAATAAAAAADEGEAAASDGEVSRAVAGVHAAAAVAAVLPEAVGLPLLAPLETLVQRVIKRKRKVSTVKLPQTAINATDS